MEQPPFQVLPPQPPPQQRPVNPPQSFWQKLWGWVVALGVALAKFKLLLFGALKTGLSMFIMIWIYSLFFGLRYAAGIVVLIFVHEMGHVLAAYFLKVPVTAPLFIPFVGAAIVMKQSPRDSWTEALLAAGGPFAGAIGSWICYAIALQENILWLMAVASTSFLINLFNMIPVPPLDGGRICAAVSRWFWLLGLVLLGVALFYFHNWRTSLLIVVIFFFMTLPRLRQSLFDKSAEADQYYGLSLPSRCTMGAVYVALVVMLLVGYSMAHEQLQFIWDMQSTNE